MVRKVLDRRRFVGLLTTTAAAGLAGCSGGQDDDSEAGGGLTDEVQETDDQGDEGTSDETGQNSFVRVTHAVPDGPDVDVFVDEEPLLEGVTFRTVSEYLPVSAGQHDVRIEATGGGSDTGTGGTENESGGGGVTETEETAEGGAESGSTAGGAPLFDEQIDVPSGTSLTIVALGEVSAETVEVRTFEDETTSGEEQTTQGEGADGGSTPTTQGDENTPGADTTPATTAPEATESGTTAGEQMTGAAETDEGGSDESRLRLLHASPDGPTVDIAFEGGEEPLITDVAFGAASEYVPITAESQTLEIRAAGGTDTLATSEVEIESETPYTAFAMGYLRGEEAETDAPFDVTLATDTTGDSGTGADGADGEGTGQPTELGTQQA